LHHVTYASFGFFDVAQGFIFISGFVAGGYYSNLADCKGVAAMTDRALRRARDIYFTHLGLIALMLGGAALIHISHPFAALSVGSLHGVQILGSLAIALRAATLLVLPHYFEILPLYVILMLLVPLLVVCWRAERMLWALNLSGCLWFLSQPDVLASPILPGWVNWGAFNFFAWQFLFVCGFSLGCLQRNQAPGAWFYSNRCRAVVFVLFSVLFVLRHSHIILGAGMHGVSLDHGPWWFAKPTLGPLRIFDFGLFACLLAQIVKKYGQSLEKTVLHRYLRFPGQHSLQVAAWSIIVWRTMPYSFKLLGLVDSHGAQIALSLLGISTLYIPAWLHLTNRTYRNRLRGPTASPPPELAKIAPEVGLDLV